jgi:hypothetical protein
MFLVTSACARRTGAAVRAEHCLQCEAGKLAIAARVASQAFERMHSTLSHGPKTERPGACCNEGSWVY